MVPLTLNFEEYSIVHHKKVLLMLEQLSQTPSLTPNFIQTIHDELQLHKLHYRCVGLINQDVVCYGTGIFDLKVRGGVCFHIEDIVVSSNMHRQGIGKKLIHHLLGVAKSHGCYKSQLTTQKENILFYESCGLHVSGVEMKIVF